MDQITVLQPDKLSDEELISRVLKGEKRLFEYVIRRHNQRLFRTGMSILADDMEVEEAMQSAYIKAYEHLSQFEQRAQFGTWLLRIMLNECLAMKKRKQRFDANEAEKHLENKSSMQTPANVLMNKELGMALESAITGLPEKYRLVFVLREIEEMSVKDTGEALGIEEQNVKVRLNRAKNMLKEELGGYFKEHVYAFHLTRCDRIVNNVLSRLHISY